MYIDDVGDCFVERVVGFQGVPQCTEEWQGSCCSFATYIYIYVCVCVEIKHVC